MGRGIATCLLSRGLNVVAFNRTHSRARQARAFIDAQMQDMVRRKVIRPSVAKDWRARFRVARTCAGLHACDFVIESVKEDLALKGALYDELESCVSPETVIASNTSSFPLVLLQKGRKHPERFVVMHWAEPAWITRFMEIVRTETTNDSAVARTEAIGRTCDKEPAVINFDIRGFITNRLMYAMLREACHLADLGVASVADIDKSFRNDIGWWATLAGPFRWMDLTGIEAYGLVMQDLLPELCNDGQLPEIMKKMMQDGAQGTRTGSGFYAYTPESATAWEETWIEFTYDIRRLVMKHEARLRKANALDDPEC